MKTERNNMRRNYYFLIISIVLAVFAISGCTENNIARNWGGTTTIQLPPGSKLVNATWKQDNLWYLIREMDENETPETLVFKEDSSFGMFNGNVVFIESRKE